MKTSIHHWNQGCFDRKPSHSLRNSSRKYKEWEEQDQTSCLERLTLVQNLTSKNAGVREAPIQHAPILVSVTRGGFYIHLVTFAATANGMRIRLRLVLEIRSSKIVGCMLARQITTTGCIPEKRGLSQEIVSCLLKTSEGKKSGVDSNK